jgi:hypothetical protein
MSWTGARHRVATESETLDDPLDILPPALVDGSSGGLATARRECPLSFLGRLYAAPLVPTTVPK